MGQGGLISCLQLSLFSCSSLLSNCLPNGPRNYPIYRNCGGLFSLTYNSLFSFFRHANSADPKASCYQNQAPRSNRLHSILYIVIALIVFTVLALVNRSLLSMELFETGDSAANSLLVQDAKRFTLLTGNYSRIGFHHPGPAILYILAAGEFCFYDATGLVRSPFAGQLLAVYLYNAGWIALLTWQLVKLLQNGWSALAATAVFVAASVLQDPQNLSGIWFPYLYYFPFAVFTLAVARFASGRIDSLSVLCLAGSVLVHGHVSFVAIAGIMVMGAFFAYWRNVGVHSREPGWGRYLRKEATAHRGQLLASAIIVTLFAFPIVLNTVLNYPGEIPKYLAYRSGFSLNGWWDSLGFLAYFWGGSQPSALVVVILMLLLIWRCKSAPGESELGNVQGVILAVVLATFAIFFYAKTGIDDLAMKYTGIFYFAAVQISIVFAALMVLGGVTRPLRSPLVALVLVISVGAASSSIRLSRADNNPDTPNMLAALRALKKQPVALDLDNANTSEWQNLWSQVVGMVALAKRNGERGICVNQNWHVLFTADFKCSELDLQKGGRYVATRFQPERQAGDGVVDVGGVRFIPYAPVRLEEPHATHLTQGNPEWWKISQLLVSGWSQPELDFTWTVGPSARVVFSVARPEAFRLALELMAFLPHEDSRQQLEIHANGRPVGQFEFSRVHNRGERVIQVPAEAVPADGVVVLDLSISNPISPEAAGVSKDSRPLGVALTSLRLLRLGE
jgi:hypothetical protein